MSYLTRTVTYNTTTNRKHRHMNIVAFEPRVEPVHPSWPRINVMMKYLLTSIGFLVVTAYGFAAQVVVDRIKCIESSDSADDIYMVVFRGQMSAPFDSNVGIVGPGNFWDDFDDGETWNQDIAIAKYSANAVYVVLLMEQDSGNDIKNADDIGTWRSLTAGAWQGVRLSQSVAGLPDNEAQRKAAANKVINMFGTALNATSHIPEDIDDKIGEPRRLVITPGTTTQVDFKEEGGDGHYAVTFKVK